jgi:hypothetical protein
MCPHRDRTASRHIGVRRELPANGARFLGRQCKLPRIFPGVKAVGGKECGCCQMATTTPVQCRTCIRYWKPLVSIASKDRFTAGAGGAIREMIIKDRLYAENPDAFAPGRGTSPRATATQDRVQKSKGPEEKPIGTRRTNRRGVHRTSDLSSNDHLTEHVRGVKTPLTSLYALFAHESA